MSESRRKTAPCAERCLLSAREPANTAEVDQHKSPRLCAAKLTHELRSPLTAIVGYAELLHDGQAGALSAAQQDFVDEILFSAQHLLQLVNDMLDLAKLEAGKLTFHPEPCDVRALMMAVERMTRLSAAGKRLSVSIDVDPEVGIVTTDPLRLKQVLLNYLSNAIKFTPPGGRIALRARRQGLDALRVEVEDNGQGIAADEIGRLFSDFSQLEAGARREGTGLGLALARRMVEGQGGEVGVSSKQGEGSVFYAVLPANASGAPGELSATG
jgi:signal transduction histidine kinase